MDIKLKTRPFSRPQITIHHTTHALALPAFSYVPYFVD